MLGEGLSSARHFRFTVLETRDAQQPTFGGSIQPVGAPSITAFGPMRNGCTLSVQGHSLNASGASLSLSFPQRIVFNGWWLATAANGSDQRQDPVRFVLEVADSDSDDIIGGSPGGQGWRVVGASWNRWTWAGYRVFRADSFETPLARNSTLKFDQQVKMNLRN